MSSARVRAELESPSRVGRTPWPTKILIDVPPREGGDAPENQGAWIRSVGNGAGEGSPLRAGRPASTRRDPSRGVAEVESQRWVILLVSPSVERTERGLRRLGRENPTRSGCWPAGRGADRSARNGHYDPKLAV